MKTIEVQVYSFNELSQEAKEVAINRFLDINVDFDWWENTYEDAKNIGLKITSFDLDRNKHAKGEFIFDASQVAEKIISKHGEACETYNTASLYLNAYQEAENKFNSKRRSRRRIFKFTFRRLRKYFTKRMRLFTK